MRALTSSLISENAQADKRVSPFDLIYANSNLPKACLLEMTSFTFLDIFKRFSMPDRPRTLAPRARAPFLSFFLSSSVVRGSSRDFSRRFSRRDGQTSEDGDGKPFRKNGREFFIIFFRGSSADRASSRN